MDRRPLVPDAVAGKQANRFLSPFGVGAATRGSAHGRPSGAHGVLRACCSLQRGSAYTHAGLSWKCNQTFFTAFLSYDTYETRDTFTHRVSEEDESEDSTEEEDEVNQAAQVKE